MEAREKELIAVAISVAAGCEYCTAFHVKAAKEKGASAPELEKMLRTALKAREEAARRIASVAGKELGLPEETGTSCGCAPRSDALEALASAACALALNNGTAVAPQLAAAQRAGAEESHAQIALALARKIKKVAAERAEDELKGKPGCETENACAAATGGGCSDPAR